MYSYGKPQLYTDFEFEVRRINNVGNNNVPYNIIILIYILIRKRNAKITSYVTSLLRFDVNCRFLSSE